MSSSSSDLTNPTIIEEKYEPPWEPIRLSTTEPKPGDSVLRIHSVDIEPRPSEKEECIKQELGKGSFGSVYKGRWKGVDNVAIKKLEKAHLDELLSESHLITTLNHPNVVRLYGVCDEEGEECMVMERCKCSLGSILGDLATHPSIPWLRRLQILHSISNGMYHLHDKEVIHGDLKSGNILIRDDGTICITDFGTSMFINGQNALTTFTVAWTAPEVLKASEEKEKNPTSNTAVDKPSDVYSFGMIMYEVFTRSFPFFFEGITDTNEVIRIVKGGGRPTIPLSIEDCKEIEPPYPSGYTDLMKECWDVAHMRPTFGDLRQRLKLLIEDETKKEGEEQDTRKKEAEEKEKLKNLKCGRVFLDLAKKFRR